jgi:hypothetical protein
LILELVVLVGFVQSFQISKKLLLSEFESRHFSSSEPGDLLAESME